MIGGSRSCPRKVGESIDRQFHRSLHLSSQNIIQLASLSLAHLHLIEMTYTLDDLPPTSTPKDYSRIQFDPSQLPKERIVGILACQRKTLSGPSAA
jgi:hypothetical protein